MYSCAQCAMQEKSMRCRGVPCLAHMEQGPDPVHPEHLPLPYLPGYWGLRLLLALNKDGPGQCSGHLQAVLRIRIRMDPHDFGLLDPHPD